MGRELDGKYTKKTYLKVLGKKDVQWKGGE